MAAGPSIDVSGWLDEQLAQASPDLLRSMVQTFAEALMGAEADAVCGAAYGERSIERTNTRNGYRRREWDTRAGSISLAIPKLAISRVKSGLWAGCSAGGRWRGCRSQGAMRRRSLVSSHARTLMVMIRGEASTRCIRGLEK
jgi:mutator family transposase